MVKGNAAGGKGHLGSGWEGDYLLLGKHQTQFLGSRLLADDEIKTNFFSALGSKENKTANLGTQR